jgi:hypothetical protein
VVTGVAGRDGAHGFSVTPLGHDALMTTKRQHTEQPEQLTLLAPTDVPLQFRLDRRTRERGLAHIAEIRRQLAARSGATPAWMQEAA